MIKAPSSAPDPNPAEHAVAAGAALPTNWSARLKDSWQHLLNELFEEEGLDTIFSHVRNMLVGAALIAAGVFAARQMHKNEIYSVVDAAYVGYSVAVAGVLLLLLNLADGLRKLARRRHHIVLRVALIAIYLAVSVRIIQLVVIFRWG